MEYYFGANRPREYAVFPRPHHSVFEENKNWPRNQKNGSPPLDRDRNRICKNRRADVGQETTHIHQWIDSIPKTFTMATNPLMPRSPDLLFFYWSGNNSPLVDSLNHAVDLKQWKVVYKVENDLWECSLFNWLISGIVWVNMLIFSAGILSIYPTICFP